MSIPEEEVWDEINKGWSCLSFRQRFLWEAIKISPEEWKLRGFGKCWVVAILGSTVIYYNHYEGGGFDCSHWHQYGTIEHYQGSQSGLEVSVQRLLMTIETGYDIGPWSTGPLPGKYPGH